MVQTQYAYRWTWQILAAVQLDWSSTFFFSLVSSTWQVAYYLQCSTILTAVCICCALFCDPKGWITSWFKSSALLQTNSWTYSSQESTSLYFSALRVCSYVVIWEVLFGEPMAVYFLAVYFVFPSSFLLVVSVLPVMSKGRRNVAAVRRAMWRRLMWGR